MKKIQKQSFSIQFKKIVFFFDDDEIESKAQYIFSFEELKNTSLNNLKKIFFNFFFDKKEKHLIDYSNILEIEKNIINEKFDEIINIINCSENIYNNIVDVEELDENSSDEDINFTTL